MKTFAELGVDPDVVETLAKHNITEPFPIQALAIPLAIKGHDLIGQARTGTGKTMAFALPLLHLV
ncbi:MAG: DEAD/DEAH box helicase, partial [Frankiaceae bacterium]|nr:DEAD/DEAH box helicase [Frankiaceae bacterium]